MKKIKVLLLLLLVSIGLVGCVNKGYEEISYEQLTKKMEKKETFVLFLGRETCSACSIFKEVLNEQKNNHKGITFYYIDLDKVTDEEEAKIITKFDISRTPTNYIIYNGQDPSSYDKFVGSNEYPNIISTLKDKGIIK